MIKADTFLPPTSGSAATVRLQGIAQGLERVYEVPAGDHLPQRIADLVSRLKAAEKAKAEG